MTRLYIIVALACTIQTTLHADIQQEKEQLEKLIQQISPALLALQTIPVPMIQKIVKELPALLVNGRLLVNQIALITPLVRKTLATVKERLKKLEAEQLKAVAAKERGVKSTHALKESLEAIKETLDLLKDITKENGLFANLALFIRPFGSAIGNNTLADLDQKIILLQKTLATQMPKLEKALTGLTDTLEKVFGK